MCVCVCVCVMTRLFTYCVSLAEEEGSSPHPINAALIVPYFVGGGRSGPHPIHAPLIRVAFCGAFRWPVGVII